MKAIRKAWQWIKFAWDEYSSSEVFIFTAWIPIAVVFYLIF
jgi:hypothetical protein